MNIKDLHSMVDDIGEKSATEIWKQLSDMYIHCDEMQKNFADSAFKGLRFVVNGSQMLAEFFKKLKVKRKEVMDFGNQYLDEDFCATIVNSLPGLEFDMMLQAFASIKVLADLIQQIELYYSHVEGRVMKVTTKLQQLLQADSNSIIQVLQARIAQLEASGKKKNDEKTCTNCKKKGHVKEDCFRPGGGKAGQWPNWWQGKHDNRNNGGHASSSLAVSLLSHLGGSAPNDGLDWKLPQVV
ncbi:hypothetical protein BDN71DRAFT_1509362 [Pleurotus eryngii]|uniref:CCHC-type domain-containing protein n=1 Tax=Pleurotus eryngii TaxID=5323 RepID=A0A9P5ZRD5_PLEER|nr:hypothetical protein BDN71DRAFT_1509362 [Pleurotus eryngii]